MQTLMHALTRLFTRPFAFVALLLPYPFQASAAAADADFSGAWVAWLCPGETRRESGLCSNFVLELHQQENRLCGAHFFATAGAARVDEGGAPSLTGDIVNGIANIVVVSGRSTPPVRVRVEMKKVKGMLQWQRLDSPRGDYLMPLSTRLTKSRSKTLFAPVFEQELRAACSSAFTMAAEGVPPSATPAKP
ncbi:MAG TPA: hypothetical protein VJ654_09815 [Noviherbaspirillum sp.]|nr:hypothetical protein [Noviherbaspirillum sp.]